MLAALFNTAMKNFVQHLKNDAVLYSAMLLAFTSTIVVRPSLETMREAIDWRVLSLLFCLMAVVSAFRKYNVLDVIAVSLLRKCRNTRSLYLTLISLVFFISMTVTNDVALLTFVPLTLILCSRAGIPSALLIIFETIAANLGSCVTPMGNPQNLFLYSLYNMSAGTFFSHTLLIGIPSFILLAVCIFVVTNKKEGGQNNITIDHISLQNPVKIGITTAVLIMILCSVFRIFDYTISLGITVVFLLIFERSIITKIDYSLLLTFVGFFIFTNNLAQVEVISSFLERMLETSFSVYVSGISISQIISNVPASLLLSGFTSQAESLLLGVNVGGLGSLIASLASVISYKLYNASQEKQEKGKRSYLSVFTFWNAVFIIVLLPLVWLLKILFI